MMPRPLFRLRPWCLAMLALCAPAFVSGTAMTPAEVTDAAGLRALVAAERARPAAPRIDRGVFLAQPMLRTARLSPDGRSVAALVDDGRTRSVWVATAAQPRGRQLLARSSAEALAYSRDGRWLILPSPGQLYALALSGQPGSGAIAAVGNRSHR